MDDGSTDGSGKICDEYERKSSRIKAFHQNNLGVSVARNAGLDISKGEWLLFVDADDFLTTNALNILTNVIKVESVDMVLSHSLILNGDKLEGYAFYGLGKFDTPISKANHPALWGYLFRNSIIKKNGIRFIPKLAHSEDRLFIYQYAIYCNNIYITEATTYVYRIVATSVTHNAYTIKSAEDHFHAASEIEKTVMPFCKNSIDRKCVIKATKSLKAMSFRGYVSHYLSMSTLASFRKMYKKYFNSDIQFIYGVLFAVIKYYGKRIIQTLNK